MFEAEHEVKTDLEKQADSILGLNKPGDRGHDQQILSDYGYQKRRAQELSIEGVEYGKKIKPVSDLLTKAKIKRIRQAMELVFPLLDKAEAKGFSRQDVLQALRQGAR